MTKVSGLDLLGDDKNWTSNIELAANTQKHIESALTTNMSEESRSHTHSMLQQT